VQTSKARNVTTMNGAKVGFAKTYTPGAPAAAVVADKLFPFAENSYTCFSGSCRYESPDTVTTGASTTPLYPNSFGNTGCASVPISLHRYRHTLRAGDYVLLVAFGGGYSSGAALARVV
jgi:hypothetical protein